MSADKAINAMKEATKVCNRILPTLHIKDKAIEDRLLNVIWDSTYKSLTYKDI